jgi:hypothetical protein
MSNVCLTILKIYQFFFHIEDCIHEPPMEKKSSSYIGVWWGTVPVLLDAHTRTLLASDPHGDMCCVCDPPMEQDTCSLPQILRDMCCVRDLPMQKNSSSYVCAQEVSLHHFSYHNEEKFVQLNSKVQMYLQ